MTTPPATRPSPPILCCRRLHKRYPDGTTALADLDLEVGHGEIVSLVGPSGCGKSTLLRIIAGLETATRGGCEVATDQLDFVFQQDALLPWLAVQQNVELAARLRRLPGPERRRRADAAIDLVGLAEFRDHRPHSLSGGMRMRVALARALTLHPDLLLLDEPFGPLDQLTRERLQLELLRLHQARRFAGVLVTHSIPEAVFLANRVLVLSDRPARVLAKVDVPFATPRPAELRYDPQFIAIASRVANSLRNPDPVWPPSTTKPPR